MGLFPVIFQAFPGILLTCAQALVHARDLMLVICIAFIHTIHEWYSIIYMNKEYNNEKITIHKRIK